MLGFRLQVTIDKEQLMRAAGKGIALQAQQVRKYKAIVERPKI